MNDEIYEIEMLTEEEKKAIKSLHRLSKKWPDTIQLFSQSGTLLVLKQHPNHPEDEHGRIVDWIGGIDSDGGDPNLHEWDD